MPQKLLSHHDYKVVWICLLEVEQIAAMEMLDEEHETLPQPRTDTNIYNLGSINGHNIVIAGLPKKGNCPAASAIPQMKKTFPNLEYGLSVGIGGGVPVRTDHGMIRLGHVVVGEPIGVHSGILQYDLDKARTGEFECKGSLAPLPTALLNAAREVVVRRQQLDHDPIWENTQRIDTSRHHLHRFKFPGVMNDYLYRPDYEHRQAGISCEDGGCDPKQRIERPIDDSNEPFVVVHRGRIASGELLINDAKKRDTLAREQGVLCFEMEATGALTDFPCMVIRGISDYCDSHKNDVWHGYAAAVAAAYARQLFFHLPVEHYESSAAHFLVPYPRNRHFVGRSDILDQLKGQLGHEQPGTNRTAQASASLYGLGGIGKTQIALAYVYWLHETSPDISIFWVHANNAECFRRSFATIAEVCQIPGYTDSRENTLLLVEEWLESKDRGRWLMVIDNADDFQLFSSFPDGVTTVLSPSKGSPGLYIPKCAHGAILCTTRNKRTASRIAERGSPIRVGEMRVEEANQLLKATLGEVGSYTNELSKLSSRLEHLPLALVQAAAFIHKSDISVEGYLMQLDNVNRGLMYGLSKRSDMVGRGSEAPRAVVKTWILTFRQIERQNKLACELLFLISLLGREAIPQEFLSHYSKTLYKGSIVEDIDLVKATGILMEFFLVGERGNSLYIHHLLQLITQKWLSRTHRMQHFANAALLTVSQMYPFGRYETRTTCEAYLPHGYAVLKLEGTKSREEMLAKASLLHHIAGYLSFGGSLDDSELLEEQCLDIRTELLGADHASTLASMANLASTYRKQGRLGEAEKLEVQVWETGKTLLGPDHPDTLSIMDNLAMIYLNQARWADNESLQIQAVEMRQQALGEEHPDTLVTMANLASTYRNQGRLKKAEDLFVQVLDKLEIVLGLEHPSTLSGMANLATTYTGQGRWQEAEALQLTVTNTMKRILGEDHPSTLGALSNLASIHQNQGRCKEAEELFLSVIEARKRVLGAEHPDTLTSLVNLALIWRSNACHNEAATSLANVLQRQERVLGLHHPDTEFTRALLDNWARFRDQPPKTEDSHSTHSEESSCLSRGDREYSTISTALSHDIVSNCEQSPKDPSLPMLFFNFQTSEIGSLRNVLPDDVQSIESVVDEIQSLDGSQSDMATTAVNYIAETLINDSDLFGLYHEAIERMDQARFVRNHRRMLKIFYLGLRAEGYTPQQKLAVDILRLRSSRLRISHEIHSSLKPWDGTTREKVETFLEQEKDKMFILDRFFEERGDKMQLNPTGTVSSDTGASIQRDVDIVSETSEDSEDHDELEDEGIGKTPNWAAVAEFLTSRQSFNSYKENLREFLRTRPKAARDMGLLIAGDQRSDIKNSNHRIYFLRILDRIQLWRRPDVQPGHKRLTWISAYGKPLYIDIEGASPQKAEALQDRFRKAATLAHPGDPTSSSTLAQLPTTPAPTYSRTTVSGTGQPGSLPDRGSGFNLRASMPHLRDRLARLDSGEERPRYLHLCITTRKSVSYRPIDVTNITHDQFLFQAVREEYFSIKNRESWALRLESKLRMRLPAFIRLCCESLTLFTPRSAELVSFFLMPIPKGQDDVVCPFGIQLSYPPEDEVLARRWEYRPCPKSFSSLQMNEAFVTTMLEPGHAYRDDAWLQLFPKKLNSKLGYERGAENLGWGIHVVEAVNTSGVVRVGLLIALASGVVGVIYSSFSGDPGSGFTIAAWITSVAMLSVASVQLSAD